MNPLVKMTRHGDIAVVTIDNPPVNALSPGVPEGIRDSLDAAAQDPDVGAIVVIGAGSTFIAGADIHQLEKIAAGSGLPLELSDIILEIEDCPKPVVMALHGTALGGGLEVAMGGHYRVIGPAGQVGQPEVNIGLIPGAGGTQRLPRLAGVQVALELCAFGNPIGARQALESGIVDRIVEGDLLQGAIAFAREVAGKPFMKTRDRKEKLKNEKARDADPVLFHSARERAAATRRGEQAPREAITAVEAVTQPFERGMKTEREIFESLLHSRESKAMIHAFFGERVVAKIPDIPKDTPVFGINRAAVIGAGTMGGGIAMSYANAGIPVIVKETDGEALDRGMAAIRGNYANSVKKGRFSQQERDRRMALISPQVDYAGFENVDVIVEAVFENMALKKRVFHEIDEIAKPSCMLASNTSTLDIDEIASATGRPHMVVGHHFFSPANVMRLLEVVCGKATSKEVLATSMALGRKLKKIAVLAGNCRGFIGNRMIHPYLREAQFLVEEGATVEQVNDALYDFGMAMGPFAMSDLAGIDVGWRIRQESRHLEMPGVRQPLVADRLYERGWYGQKTGRGWSKYGPDRKPLPDTEVAELIELTALEAGVERGRPDYREIVERCIFALVNEGAKLLEEKIALRAVDIDVVYLNGYGFPRRLGGPMFYADTLGLPNVLARIEEFESTHGSELWSPAPLLRRLASENKTFNA